MAPPDKITVAIRVRPITETGGHDVVTHDDSSSSLIIGADRSFTFDYIFSNNSEQISVYETLVLSLVNDCLHGINATVLAYGQTGSGKTYTMGTAYEFEGAELPPSAGIIPRAFMDLFERIKSMEDVEVNVEAQFVELYNEELHDLLTPKKNIVKVQEKSGGGIYLSGATTVALHSAEEALAVLRSGGYSRSTASTKMNAQSSRSHAILTLLVNQKKKDETGLRVELISSKFHFVDLAGSERLGRTGAEGDRAKEGIKINFGLLALGNVINALSENQKHVPYRDSKLTRLLCDSLGGNSRTVLIACISPADIDLGESVNTLQYATRAKKIRNVISVNVDNLSSSDAAVLKKLMAENRRLRQQLKTRGGSCQASRPASSYAPSPRRGVTARPPLAPKIKDSLIQLVRAFDKALNIRVKQMSAITGVAVTRYRKKLELSNLRLQYEVLRGCGDVKAFPMVNRLRALEKEVEDADSEISTLASALRRSGASIQDLQEKVARIVLSFPPCWRHIPQTARSLMSAQLADYESFGLQCYNNNLLHIIRLCETEHERGLSAVRQLNDIVGVSILRHFLPKLMNTVTADRSYGTDAFDEGIKKEVPALSTIVASLFDGSSRTRTAAFSAGPTVKRSADPFMKIASNTHAKPRSAAMTRSNYAADRVPPLHPPAANTTSPPPTYAGMNSPPANLQCRTVSRPTGLRQVLSPVPGLPPKMPIFGASPPRARKSFVAHPADVDTQQLVSERIVDPFAIEDHDALQSADVSLKTRVVWHNGLPLPVVDDFERENRCPLLPDTVPKSSTHQSLDTTTIRVDGSDSAATSIVAALNSPQLSENHLSGSKRSMPSTVADDGEKSPLKGQKKRFVLRQSTIERFARCGIDFDSLAPH